MITGKIPKDCYWKTNLVFKVGGGGGGGEAGLFGCTGPLLCGNLESY